MLRKTILAFILINSSLFFYGQTVKDTTTGKDIEVSFGQNLLFISNSQLVNLKQTHAVVVPTSSILLFAQLRTMKKIRIPLFFNIATEAKQFIVNGQIVNERSTPTFGTGASFKAVGLKMNKSTTIELELSLLSSFLVNKNLALKVAPVLAGRIRILKGNDFTMYLGTSYSLGINAFGLFYGTGTLF